MAGACRRVMGQGVRSERHAGARPHEADRKKSFVFTPKAVKATEGF